MATKAEHIDGEVEARLMERLQLFRYDPLGFVRFAFPWGEPGTPLANYKEPRRWQVEEFRKISEHLKADVFRKQLGLTPKPYYLAVSSGRGPGKSAFLGMLELWMASCWVGSTGIVTANTETQLRSRTMAELGKWHMMAINAHWFEKSSMSLRPAKWFAELLEQQLKMDTQYYYVEGQSWSKENPDGFAGAHSTVGMLLCMDEASGIDDAIWSVSEGFFTDLSEVRLWVCISNPRRNSGKFYDCFHTDRQFWNTRYIDSREVEGVDREVYQRIADKYGEDSDTTRVEVRGLFPITGANQFFSPEMIRDSQDREVRPEDWEPLIMGVDIARSGNNKSVVRLRQGRDAKSFPVHQYKEKDSMVLAQTIGHLITKYKPDAVNIDGGGVGGPVIDRLRQLRYRVNEIQSAERPVQADRYANKRVEMYGDLKEWMETGAVDDSEDLFTDLLSIEYDHHKTSGKLILTPKTGDVSPDDSDALALTFARPVARAGSRIGDYRAPQIARDVDYAIFGA